HHRNLHSFPTRRSSDLDMLPYKIGNSIPEQMKPSEPYKFEYVFEKDGKTHRFSTFPDDTTYIYKDMITLNEDKARPKITDYRVWNDSTDFTQERDRKSTRLNS